MRYYFVARILPVLFGLLLMPLFQGCRKKPPSVPPEVTVFTVSEQEVDEVMTLVGRTVADYHVELRARVTGFLDKRLFDEGAYVKKDELLFQIEKDQYQAEVEHAEADLAIAEAVLKNAVISYERLKFLREKDSVSQADLDKAEADKDSAEGDRKAAKASLDDAQIRLGYTDIRAPYDGRIGLSTFTVGNLVGPASEPLATVVSLDPMCVEFSIPEPDFLRAQENAVKAKLPFDKYFTGIKVSLTLSDKSQYPHPGKIYFWDNVVHSYTGTIAIRAKFPNSEHFLTPGQYVRVNLRRAAPIKGLVMPQSAIQFALGSKFVMTIDDKNVVGKKAIEPGYQYMDMVVINKGLSAGDKVITHGFQKIRTGMTVTPVMYKHEAPKPDPGSTPVEDKIKSQDEIL